MKSSRPLILLTSLFLLACVAFSQSFTSSIAGAVNDPSGSSIAGAKVQLVNTDTNDTHETMSTGNGAYQFNNLQPGPYRLTVTAPGFTTYVREGLVLQANVNSTVNLALQLGPVEQKVEVNETAVLVDTQTANNTVTLDSQLLQSLPNATRNPLNFVFAVAGTTEAPGGQTARAGTLDQMSSNFGINGGRTGEETILVDGAPSQAVDWGGLMVSPLQDSVQEQQILINTYDAQYERGGAGIVTLITRGGTNRFHGEAYDYLQNSALNANSWSNNKYGLKRGQFKQNQFGGNISGPISRRANLFFFGGYEGLRQPNTQSTLTTVPTQAERNGDFSQSFNPSGGLATIYNPFTTTAAVDASGNPLNVTGYTRQAFTNNVIPSSLFDPVGVKIVNLYPLPNRAGQGPNNLNNYFAQGSGNTLNDKIDTRVDWEQSAQHRLFVRWSDRFRQNQIVPCFFCNGADTGVNQTNHGFQVALNDTLTPDPTWVINSYVSYSRWLETHTAQDSGNSSIIGLSPSLFQAPVFPTIGADNGYSQLGSGTFQHFARTSDTAMMNATKQLSKHTLKFGGNFDVQMINVLSEAAGSFNFSSAQTSCDPDTSGICAALPNQSSSLTGNSIASMLLGTSSGGGQGFSQVPAVSLHIYGAYIQDQWRISSKLTLNVGVRYENQRPATERLNQMSYFNPDVVNPISNAVITNAASMNYGQTVSQAFGRPIRGGLQYAGANGTDRYLWRPNNHDFAPRVGIAYRFTEKLVARLGAGIFYLPPTALIGTDGGLAYGFSSSTPYNATTNGGVTPVNLISNPFPNGLNTPTGNTTGLSTQVGDFIGAAWLTGPHPNPYSEQWSADLQYQIRSNAVLEVGYSGNRGKRLLYGNSGQDLNQLADSQLALGSALLNSQVANPFYGIVSPNSYYGQNSTIAYNLLLRQYPQFTGVQPSRNYEGARSHFDALYVKYNYRMGNGLSLLTTYQWSKALDNGSEDYFGWGNNADWRDVYNTRADYAISTHDVPQSFATAVVYDLPYGRGKHWGNSAPAVVKEVLGNWQVSSVIRLASGLPLAPVTDGGNPLGQYGFPGSQLPDWIGNPQAKNRTADNWINPAAFVAPTFQQINGDPNNLIYRYGNAPLHMTQLRERNARNVDFSVAKNFGGERYQAWLRGEFLNLFNYAQYNGFCTDLTGSNCVVGAAQGTENAPRTIQMSLKLAF